MLFIDVKGHFMTFFLFLLVIKNNLTKKNRIMRKFTEDKSFLFIITQKGIIILKFH